MPTDRIVRILTLAVVCLCFAVLAGAYGRARGLAAAGELPVLTLRGSLE